MKKMSTEIWRLEAVRDLLIKEAPELTDLGMRIASVKATALEHGQIGRSWSHLRVAIYLTEAEWLLVERLTKETPQLLASKWEDDRGPATDPSIEFGKHTKVTTSPFRTDFAYRFRGTTLPADAGATGEGE